MKVFDWWICAGRILKYGLISDESVYSNESLAYSRKDLSFTFVGFLRREMWEDFLEDMEV
jgi:hypothetical protein